MSRMLVVLVVLSLSLSVFGWVMAAEHESGPEITILPFEPESGTFWIFGMDWVERSCWKPLEAQHNETNMQAAKGIPFATNDPETACTLETNPNEERYQIGGHTGGTITIYLLPALTNETPFDTSQNIKGKVVLGYTKHEFTEGAPFNAGYAKPTFRLQHTDWEQKTTVIGTTTVSASFPDDLENAPGDDIWVTFEFDFGPAPENITKAGHLRLIIDIRNQYDQGEINLVAQRIALSVEERHRGFIELPFTEESCAFTPQRPLGATSDCGGSGGGGSGGGGGGGSGSPDAPTAAFDLLPTSDLQVGSNITFNASASSDPADANLTYAWDFGDGTTGDGMVTHHSYGAAGNYTVALTVTNDAGLSDTTNQTVTIVAAGDDNGGSNVTNKESGFLPGFETALVVGVGFVAAALASRRRET